MLVEKIKKIVNKKFIGIIIIVILIVGYIITFIYFNNEINTKTK